MADPFEQVLRLVAQGRLTAEEAGPILDALGPAPNDPGTAVPAEGPPRFARVQVREGGRTAVDLRVPLSLGRMALAAIPGLAGTHAAELSEAIERGTRGPIVDVSDDDGDSVRIVLE